MLEIERERAKERNSETAGDGPSCETFHETEKGRAKDKAAEKVNADVSGRTRVLVDGPGDEKDTEILVPTERIVAVVER
jgi:hypothetical protein